MRKNKAHKYLETNQNKYYNIPIKYIFFEGNKIKYENKRIKIIKYNNKTKW